HQCKHRRLRAVKARQIKERDPMFRGKRRQHCIKGVTIGEQRMQDNEIAAFARAYGGKRAASGAQLLKLHCCLRARSCWAMVLRRHARHRAGHDVETLTASSLPARCRALLAPAGPKLKTGRPLCRFDASKASRLV